MSKKIVFIATGRGGSRFLGQMLTGVPTYNYVGGDQSQYNRFRQYQKSPTHYIFIATQPKFICPLYALHHVQSKGDPVFTQFDKFYLRDNSKYETEAFFTTASWRPEKILADRERVDVTVLRFMRDGRNIIGSWKGFETIHAKKPFNVKHVKVLAMQYRDQARIALDCKATLDDCHIIKFEDGVMNPILFMENITNLTGIPFDIGMCMSSYASISPDSSFKNSPEFKNLTAFYRAFKPTDTLVRWKTLTEEEREAVHQIAGQELIDLGYITDDSWIEE